MEKSSIRKVFIRIQAVLIATGVVDTGNKFTAGVIKVPVAVHLTCEYRRDSPKKLKMTQMLFLGALGEDDS
jgi:hypothetical protein